MELFKLLLTTALLVFGAHQLVRVVSWYLKRRRLVELIDKIPGPKSYPFFGTIWQLIGIPRHETFKIISSRTKIYGGIFRLWIGSQPDVRLSQAEFVEPILCSSKHLKKSLIYDFIRPWLGEGLLLSDGEHWHRHRKIITPTFHFTILEGFCSIFYENSETLVNRVKKFCGTGTGFDIYPYITKMALDIICETSLGTKVNAQSDTDSGYVKSLYDFIALLMDRFFKVWLHNDFIFSLTEHGKQFTNSLTSMHDFTKKIIREKQEERRRAKAANRNEAVDDNDDDGNFGKKKRRALLDVLLESNENGNLMTDTNIREEVDTFMFEGHDTTTAGITWSLFLIGLHDDVQKKLAEEQKEIFGDSRRAPCLEDLAKMKYLERVVKEAMRLYPPISIIGRQLSEDVEIGGYRIPKDCNVGIHIYNLHRDERYFPDPERFDPDRFTPENTLKLHPYAYLPFSAGPRNCIGQKFAMNEEKCVISTFLRHYKIQSMDKREDVLCVNELVLRPYKGIRLTIYPRM